jgi:hypothetical protein
MAFRLFGRKEQKKPSIRKKALFSLGSIAVILVLSGVISILEYRRMSEYVSGLVSANIQSIVLSQELSDITEEYNHQMLAVVIQNDISIMPDFDKELFMSQSDALKNSITAPATLSVVQKVDESFDRFISTSQKFDEVFLADALLHGDHGDDAHLPTTTMPLVMPTCTAVMMSMALVPWAVIVILFTTAIRSTTITMASPLLFKLPMPVPMAMPVAAAMPMMFAMPVTARPLAVDVAHDHASAYKFAHEFFVVDSH